MEDTNQLLAQLGTKIDQLNTHIKSEFKALNDRVIEVEKSIIKLDEKVSGIDKRLSNEETVSRTAFGAILAGVALSVIKYLFFPN